MARMYSRKKGRSGSVKPVKKSVPTWLKYRPKEIELLILKMAKEGRTSSEIGIYLRDTYGIPDVSVVCKKNISRIMKDKRLYPEIPEDLFALMKKAAKLRKHLDENRKDQPGVRGLQLTNSKINRLIKYYKRNKILAVDWKYDPEKMGLFMD